ncbi:MAG: NAD(P)H-dependent oxidoreductase subunit E [Saprospiraceae bacterium]|nr:NAD(P)H-dependent oxidoreductase subunit E [Saprospiraceae bacterium]
MTTTHHSEKTLLLNLLWACQDAKGFISNQDIFDIAAKLDVSAIEVEGVCTFYHFFHRKPAGKYIIYLNNSILSELKGYSAIRKALEQATGGHWGGVDSTGQFGLFDTSCIGLSDQEPAMLINFYPFVKVTPERVFQLISALRAGASLAELADTVEDHLRYVPPGDRAIFFRDFAPGRALQRLTTLSPQQVIDEIREAHLLGMGGAFFPTADKWQICRNNPGEQHYLVCNADEGEPGTFKDRVLMNRLPELLIEGMIVGGYAIGAAEGIIYLRAEYRYLLPRLEAAIATYKQLGWLGQPTPAKESFTFDIRIQMGAGAYVCGEETALLDSLMGKRGEPWPKVFFPVERGYLGQPTSVNNVETLCAAARIIELGANKFRSLGTPGSPGTKLLSVAGDCRFPGIYEIEWGMTVGELLGFCGAEDPYFIQVSGPSGICVPAAEQSRCICHEDLLCGGSVMVFNTQRDLLQVMINFTEFFKKESCGVCTPCRAGNFILGRKLDLLKRGLARPADLEEIRQWGQLLGVASRCGLGKASAHALINAMQKFPAYFQQRVRAKGREKGFDLDRALGDYREAVEQTS